MISVCVLCFLRSERANAKRAASTSRGSIQAWHGENDLRNVQTVDREIEELMRDAKQPDEEEDTSEEEDDKIEETSTGTSVVQYDELR